MSGTMDGAARPTLVGNRWMLVGGVLYLLEWVAIIGVGLVGVTQTAAVGVDAEDLLDSYRGHVDAVALMAGWFAVVLLGRVLVFIGLRSALADSGTRHPLMDWAVAAAAVSVTLEIAAYGLASAAADLTDTDDTTAMLLLDRAGGWVNQMIAGGLGVAVLCSVYCMWRSGLFSRALNVLGLVSGIGLVAAQLSIAPALEALFVVLAFSALLFWIWMLWAGTVLWRRTSRSAPHVPAQVTAD